MGMDFASRLRSIIAKSTSSTAVSPMPAIMPEHTSRSALRAAFKVLSRSVKVWVVQILAYWDEEVLRL